MFLYKAPFGFQRNNNHHILAFVCKKNSYELS